MRRLLLTCLLACYALPASAAWWDSNWAYRLAFDVNEPSGSAVTNQQFRVSLGPTSLHAGYTWSASGDDVRFIDAITGNEISYFIQSWDSGTESATILLLIPSLTANETRRIYLYYGNPSAATQSDPITVLTEAGLQYHTRYSTVDPASLSEALTEFYSRNDSVAGYGCTTVTDFTLIDNSNLFGPPNNDNDIAFYSSHHFEVTASNVGNWSFQFGGDYGYGGGMYVDGIPLEEAWNEDRWWNLSWSNTAETFDGTISLSQGWHTLELIGFEGCCDGGTSVRFRQPSAPTSWKSWSTSNLNIRSEKCLSNSGPAAPVKVDLSTSTHQPVDVNGGDAETGDVIRYTITLTETGGAEAEHIAVTAEMPAGVTNFTIVSVPAGATDNSNVSGGANSAGLLDVSGIQVPANGSVTIVYEYTIGILAGGSSLDVTATVDNPGGDDDVLLAAPTVTTVLSGAPLADVIKNLYFHSGDISRVIPTTDEGNTYFFEGTTTTWALAPVLQKPLTIDDGATEIRTWLYVRRLYQNTTRDITITISGSSSGTIAREDFNNVYMTNTGYDLIPFDVNILGSAPSTLQAGEEIRVSVRLNSGSGFQLLDLKPSDGSTHSYVEFPTDTAINVESIETYDAPWPGGSLVASFEPGDTVYVRARVSDPFGAFDISAADLGIEDPNSVMQVTTDPMTEITTGGYPSASEKLYEYAYTLPSNASSGYWTLMTGADEGEEGTVRHEASSVFEVASSLVLAIDVGTGSASTCSGYDVTVRAEDGGGNAVTNYTGTVDLATSSGHGTWSTSATGPFSDASADDGMATYTFVAGDMGEVTFTLSNTHADDTTVTAADSTNGLSVVSSLVSFRDNRFEITSADSLGYDVIAGRPHAFEVSLYRRDTSTGNCSVASGYAGQKPLKAWVTRDVEDPGGSAPSMTGATTLASLPNAQPGSNNVDLDFIAGVATVSLGTSDVGKYTLNVLDDTSGFALDQNGAPLEISSSASNAPWVVRPFALRVVAAGNPGATTGSGATYVSAGTDFDVTVSGVRYQAADDDGSSGGTASDGIADSPSDLVDNLAAASFGNEGETVTIASSLSLPAGGNDPGLAGASTLLSSFSAGSSTSTYHFNEVGVIAIDAAVTDGNYLGAGATRTARMVVGSGPVGRFYPDHFTIVKDEDGAFAPACGTFSYSGQSFDFNIVPAFTISPRDAADSVVLQNYQGAFAHLTAGEISVGYPSSDAGNGLAVSVAPASSVLTPNGDGTMAFSPGILDAFTYTRNSAAVVGPFTSNLAVSISGIVETTDGIGAAGIPVTANPTGIEVRYGRLMVANAFGPETADLPVTARAEYFSGGGYATNTADGCTALAGSVNTTPDSVPSGSLSNIPVGAGTTSVLFSSPVISGNLGLSFLAPGAGNTGDVQLDVDLSALPWLQFDWDGDGSLDSTLTRQVTFGQYRGHDRVIYWREVHN
ncbi:MAG: CCXG family PEP-CTERM protein [Pseudomonadales bacterium]|nr:CCXG family PEP-CTERM protein [Pseudomonadales bacterium]